MNLEIVLYLQILHFLVFKITGCFIPFGIRRYDIYQKCY